MAKAEFIAVVAKAKAGICLFEEFSESSSPSDLQKNIFQKIPHRGFTVITFIQHEPHKPQLQVARDTLKIATTVFRLCIFCLRRQLREM